MRYSLTLLVTWPWMKLSVRYLQFCVRDWTDRSSQISLFLSSDDIFLNEAYSELCNWLILKMYLFSIMTLVCHLPRSFWNCISHQYVSKLMKKGKRISSVFIIQWFTWESVHSSLGAVSYTTIFVCLHWDINASNIVRIYVNP